MGNNSLLKYQWVEQITNVRLSGERIGGMARQIRKNLVGRTFGQLEVIEVAAGLINTHTAYFVFCNVCQNLRALDGSLMTRTCRPITSCCGRARVNLRHGHCSNGKRTGIYRSWAAMLTRVRNTNQANHKYYADVKVCKRWLKFSNFAFDMGGIRPEGTTLGRRLDGGMYCKSRCSWQTVTEQREQQRLKKLAA